MFSGFYWSCFNINQKRTFIFNDKYKSISKISDYFFYFNYSFFKRNDIFNYLYNLKNKFFLSNIKRFLFYQKNKIKISFYNFYNINKFFNLVPFKYNYKKK